MPREWTADDVMAMTKGYQCAAVVTAAAELDLFGVLSRRPRSAEDVARELGADLRATTVLLDALAALELVDKRDGRYALPASAARTLTEAGAATVLAMVQHHANCQRRWAQLASVVRTGEPAERRASIRGEVGDEASFIEAMNNICGPVASTLIEEIGPPVCQHLLDIGGASGTWTIALLRANPEATATLFDLPHVIPMAERRISQAGLSDRVELVAGDFLMDPLPGGADLAWISAIVHQNSRDQNRHLFSSAFDALRHGGRIYIRDVIMDDSRTSPVAGALFAINMLVATEGGATFTFDELREDLSVSGFEEVTLVQRDEGMDSIVRATRPGRA